MSRAQEIGADIFPTPEKIALGFFLVGWNVNGGQGAAAIEDRELAGIAPVRLHATAGAREESGPGQCPRTE
jgi:hypothetical protein